MPDEAEHRTKKITLSIHQFMAFITPRPGFRLRAKTFVSYSNRISNWHECKWDYCQHKECVSFCKNFICRIKAHFIRVNFGIVQNDRQPGYWLRRRWICMDDLAAAPVLTKTSTQSDLILYGDAGNLEPSLVHWVLSSSPSDAPRFIRRSDRPE